MNATNQIKLLWKMCVVCVMAITLLSIAPMQQTFAGTTTGSGGTSATAITNTLCLVINQLTGPIGKAISILIVISLAIALFLGKITWGVAIAVAVGMGILFGAKNVVDILNPGSEAACV